MKKVVVVLMLVLCIAGCRNNQKKVYTQSDLKEEIKNSNKDVDWIGLYLRCHELDSIKNLAEGVAAKGGQPFPALPDSVGVIWSNMLNEILLRHGDIAFDRMYDNHRADIQNYLRLDFINYDFITKVYLPYKATVSTRDEYGVICIKELEDEMSKCQMTMMYTGQEPTQYEDVLKQLFHAYVNFEKYDDAEPLCDIVLSYLRDKYGEDSLDYANMLNNKANLCSMKGNNYSAMVAAKRTLGIYDNILANPGLADDVRAKVSEDKKKLEDKLQLWQGK